MIFNGVRQDADDLDFEFNIIIINIKLIIVEICFVIVIKFYILMSIVSRLILKPILSQSFLVPFRGYILAQG